MFNKIILVGNLSRDIELRYSQGGMAIANTAIATSRKFTVNGEKKEEVCFIDITFFARSAEVANQYLRKGSKILVEGRLKLDSWVDQNGQKRSKHSVVVETMQMLDSKQDSQQQPQQQSNYQKQQSYAKPYDASSVPTEHTTVPKGSGRYDEPQPTQPTQSMGYDGKPIPIVDIEEDEIPF